LSADADGLGIDPSFFFNFPALNLFKAESMKG